MKKTIFLAIIFVVILNLSATTIYLVNGKVLNGEIKGKSKSVVYFFVEYDGIIISIKKEEINKIIDSKDIDITDKFFSKEDFKSKFKYNSVYELSQTKYKLSTNTKHEMSEKYKYKIKPEFFAITGALILLAWDNYSYSKDLKKAIDLAEDTYQDDKIIKDLEKEKGRKQLLCYMFSISSIITITAAIEKIEIKASPNSLEISYNF